MTPNKQLQRKPSVGRRVAPQLLAGCAYIAELKYRDGSYCHTRWRLLVRGYFPRCFAVADSDGDMRFETTAGMLLDERSYVFDRLLIDA